MSRITALVADIGGGSTELVLGSQSTEAAYSMDVGSVRLTERHRRADPPTREQIAAMRSDVEAALVVARRTVDISRAVDVIGVAGTITTVTAHALALTTYDPRSIDGSRLPLQRVLDACDSLAGMSRDERAALPYLHPGRVDVIAAGAVVWATVLRAVADATAEAGTPLEFVTTSEHDILDGVALSLAGA